MGCNNSHLRPFFRRCRRRSKNKDDAASAGANSTPKRQAAEALVDSNHVDDNTSSSDLLHGFQFLGSSIKTKADASTDQPACVPLLAQSELSHSQIDFFKMLDDKIQQGPDYDSEDERQETERLIKNNLETWRKSIENSNNTPPPVASSSSSSVKKKAASKLGNNSAKSRCQWDEEGD